MKQLNIKQDDETIWYKYNPTLENKPIKPSS